MNDVKLEPQCVACGGRRLKLCRRCEIKYLIYVSLFRPKKTRSTDGNSHMRRPQTRLQWAAHQKKAKV